MFHKPQKNDTGEQERERKYVNLHHMALAPTKQTTNVVDGTIFGALSIVNGTVVSTGEW